MRSLFTFLRTSSLATLAIIGTVWVFATTTVQAQKTPNPNALSIARQYLAQQQTAWKLTAADVQNAALQYQYETEANGLTHCYFIQTHAGIELYNGIANVNIMPDGEVLYAGNRFVGDLASKVNATTPLLTPEQALDAALTILGITKKQPTRLKERFSNQHQVFENESASLQDMMVKLRYQILADGRAHLAYDLNVEPVSGTDHWSLRIDALTGALLDKTSWTTHCSIHPDAYHHHDNDCDDHSAIAITDAPEEVPSAVDVLNIGGGSYRVFALPLEAPSFGARTLVQDPADSLASPYGWHDTNGAVGPEFTITRGNNVNAYTDWNNTSSPSTPQPNGGATLNFDTPYFPALEPDTSRDAAVINLFYMNNMIHDIAFRYGFDEPSGNFQIRNYTGRSGGNDGVSAEAQDGRLLATPTLNNANMATPNDGLAPRMQMFLWEQTGASKLLHVTAPSTLIGDYSCGTATGFGAQIGATPVTGDVVIVNDGTGTPTYGCNTLLNTNLTGKIAMIDRGTCTFTSKVKNAQNKGAIAAIICNFEAATIPMGGTDATITIPVVMLSSTDCQRIRVSAGSGLRVSLYSTTASGPARVDGDYDNGIITHEYTHGISNRLTGGPNNSACLNNAEQMGEGWSDFLALAMTVKAGDRGATPRGMGTYVYREPTTGSGIRRYPYSTDMTINPLTYDRIISNPEVHDLGEVWTATLWDLYWAMSDLYGFDPNPKNINSGNGRAVRLVMDGMKIQPCSPGFIDGRDAILAADRANFAGANQCLIWEVFARRGFGNDAVQGLSSNTQDNSEGFTKYPYCVRQLKIEKTMTESINPGDTIRVTLKVINHKGATVTGVVVTDEIPANATFVAGTANGGGTASASALTWNVAQMLDRDTVTLTYVLRSSATRRSVAQFYDGMENGDANWDIVNLVNTNIFRIATTRRRTGTKAWAGVYPATDGVFDQVLQTFAPLTIAGANPVLRFYHNYETEAGFDGGLIQISTDGGTVWQDLGSKMFRTPYRGLINYQTFVLPNQKAFWGSTNNTFVPTYVDLSAYTGQNAKFRFRFGGDSLDRFAGWFIDDVMVMDMVTYNGTARARSAQGDTATVVAPFRGTVVEPVNNVATSEIANDFSINAFPNPTSDFLNLEIRGAATETATVTLTDVAGREVWRQKATLSEGAALLPIDLQRFTTGVYFVKVSTDKEVRVVKVMHH
jgi:extracellular elastinolytic metalloproteinase